MKYRGRIALLFLSLLTSFIFLVNGDDVSCPLFIIYSFFHAAFLWVFGGWYDKYKYLSYYDPLTGVFNRRYAYNVFEKKFHRAMKRNEKIGIITIDIDQFKLMNDTYGHDYGDNILKELCRLIEKSIRKEDILVRWGGDEFLLLLVNRDNADVELFMEQLNERFKTIFSQHQEEKKTILSLSVGFSMFPQDANNLLELISIADERMYHIKRKMKLKERP